MQICIKTYRCDNDHLLANTTLVMNNKGVCILKICKNVNQLFPS